MPNVAITISLCKGDIPQIDGSLPVIRIENLLVVPGLISKNGIMLKAIRQ